MDLRLLSEAAQVCVSEKGGGAMSGEVCGDDRFELIAKAKRKLLECTNIESSPEEVEVLDNILFRCWQMGWLDQLRENRWYQIFGTPERAAWTLMYVLACKDSRPWVSCGSCPILDGCAVRSDGHDALLEWLRGDE